MIINFGYIMLLVMVGTMTIKMMVDIESDDGG